MGDPRRLKSKFSGPSHPWKKARLEEEKILFKEYGLKNKIELYKANSKVKGFAHQAKKLIALTTEQAKKEAKQLLDRLARLGLLGHGAKLDDVLNLTTKDILERRLQTVVFKKGLSRSQKQARQFITHQHIMVNDKVVSVPAYVVPVSEEASITFREVSSLSSADHPERTPIERKKEPPKTQRKEEKKGERTRARKPARKTAKPAEAKNEKKV